MKKKLYEEIKRQQDIEERRKNIATIANAISDLKPEETSDQYTLARCKALEEENSELRDSNQHLRDLVYFVKSKGKRVSWESIEKLENNYAIQFHIPKHVLPISPEETKDEEMLEELGFQVKK